MTKAFLPAAIFVLLALAGSASASRAAGPRQLTLYRGARFAIGGTTTKCSVGAHFVICGIPGSRTYGVGISEGSVVVFRTAASGGGGSTVVLSRDEPLRAPQAVARPRRAADTGRRVTLNARDELTIAGTHIHCVALASGFFGCTINQPRRIPVPTTYGIGIGRGSVSLSRVGRDGRVRPVYSRPTR